MFAGSGRVRRGRRRRRSLGGAADAVGAARAAHRRVGDRAHPAAAHVQLAEPHAPPRAQPRRRALRL